MQQTNVPIITVLIPVYSEQEALRLLLPRLDHALVKAPPDAARWRILLVNDGDLDSPLDGEPTGPFERIESIEVLSLSRNLGHQRAIAVGLAELQNQAESNAVVVMDGDGEDDPEDVPRLLQALEAAAYRKVVFAERRKRSEGVMFWMGYHLYRHLHRLLTGVAVRFGNFSIIPKDLLDQLVCADELWNHYAASVVKLRLPITLVPTARAPRLAGNARMNTVALVVHGLSAMSVFSDRIGVRLLFVTMGCGVLVLGLIFAAVGVRFLTTLAIAGWATYTTGILLLLLGQLGVACLLFAFMTLSGRTMVRFLPKRDYVHYIRNRTRVYPADEGR